MIDDVVSATIAHTGYPEAHVRQFVEPALSYMLREYGGDRLPKATRRGPPAEDIRAAASRGVSKRELRKRFRIGKLTLDRILGAANSGGVPEK
ncbi:MAG: hypothetical protein ACTHK2_13840 [Dokdonella sp.]|uniref:hypothetical protein n=1 Tax=Dokdonella sp. TaxID=2291710 RepID=UPI003F7EDEF7